MRTTPESWNGTGEEHETETQRSEAARHRFPRSDLDTPPKIEERLNGGFPANGSIAESAPAVALFCHEAPDSPIGKFVGGLAGALADKQCAVHIFSRRPYEFFHPGVYVHALGDGSEPGYLGQVEEFTRRASNAFLRQFPTNAHQVSALGFEWSTIPALSLLHANKNVRCLLSLQSLERQRSDLSRPESRRIEEIEQSGLREFPTILIHEEKVAEHCRAIHPEGASRLLAARWTFPTHPFESKLDAGAVKSRYQIGPIDPMVLFVGDMDDRHGPDVLMKAVPAILRNHKQARFAFLGDGAQLWPLKVHARYCLIDHAVRLLGAVQGPAAAELVQAADVIAVPSREQTEWWPILAGWAASKPVVTTHEMAAGLSLRHEQDAVLTYPNPNSFVWGVERLLFDPDLMRKLGKEGRKQLDERFGVAALAQQVHDWVVAVVAKA